MVASGQIRLNLRILVVEDMLMLAELLVDQLEDHGCQAVGPAGHLSRGIALARTETLDGALLDINLNGERCFPIARVLSDRSIPFAFLTGYGESVVPAEFHDIPRLAKPYSPTDLRALLEQHFGARS